MFSEIDDDYNRLERGTNNMMDVEKWII
jgi:hypothetical protein